MASKFQVAEEMRELLWYGEKMKAGDTPTEEETATMFRHRERTCAIARYMFNLKPEDYAYTPGLSFEGEPTGDR